MMNDLAHVLPPAAMPQPEVSVPNLDTAAVFFALGSQARWPIVQMLADGREMTASEVAAELGRDFDAVAKHLRVLRDAGVTESRSGEDRRLTYFYIPARYRPAPGRLDFGVCLIRLNQAS